MAAIRVKYLETASRIKRSKLTKFINNSKLVNINTGTVKGVSRQSGAANVVRYKFVIKLAQRQSDYLGRLYLGSLRV